MKNKILMFKTSLKWDYAWS